MLREQFWARVHMHHPSFNQCISTIIILKHDTSNLRDLPINHVAVATVNHRRCLGLAASVIKKGIPGLSTAPALRIGAPLSTAEPTKIAQPKLKHWFIRFHKHRFSISIWSRSITSELSYEILWNQFYNHLIFHKHMISWRFDLHHPRFTIG